MTSSPVARRIPPASVLAPALALLLGVGCSSGSTASGGAGGSPSGGAGGTAGTTSSGGTTTATWSGGTTSQGGTTGNGGTTSVGGTTSQGGTTGNGGTTSAGGTTRATSSGGTTARGGITGSGGTTSATSSGGTTAAGGTTGSGGTSTMGGTTGAGGTTDTTSSGGSTGAGGTTTPPTCAPTAPTSGVFASPTGTGSTCSLASPCSAGTALGKASSTTPVYLRGGTYSNTSYLGVSASGTADAWVIISAYPCELPIIDPGSLALNGTYISVRGIVTRNSAGGFGNKWVGGGATNSNGNLEFINCIADMHSRNGIAFYSAKGVHIKQSIVAHTGFSTSSSWSSGFNIFGAQGTYQDNIVEQNVAFENMDNQKHTDGSGFIVDDVGTGTTFRNNIGFRNGGSCIRLTTTTGTHIINNSCYGNGLDAAATGPSTPDEIFFSSSATTQGAVVYNNIAVASGKGGDTQAIFGSGSATLANNLTNNTGNIDMWVDADGTNPDYHLQATATTAIGQGTETEAPTEDIGFDPKCIVKKAPTDTGTQSWWLYSIDYAYIESIGGVSQCFHPKARSGKPDLGAYAL